MAEATAAAAQARMARRERFHFGRLLQESRQMNARIRAGTFDSTHFMPQLQRGLEQVEELSSALAARANAPLLAAGDGRAQLAANESKAALLLAARGYDLGAAMADLRRVPSIVSGAAAFSDDQALPLGEGASSPSCAMLSFERDVATFLQSQTDASILASLERITREATRVAARIVEQRQVAACQAASKQAIERIRVDRQPAGSHASFVDCAPAVAAPLGGILRMAPYAKAVRAFNEERVRGSAKAASLPALFLQAALADTKGAASLAAAGRQGGDSRLQVLSDCWQLLASIHGGEEGAGENVFDVTPRDLAPAYEASMAAAESAPWRRRLVEGSRAFLERAFLSFVDETLAQYPRDALLGGRPSAMERVRAFTLIKFKRLSPGDVVHIEVPSGASGPVWMIIFYLVRAGLLSDAHAYALSVEHLIQRGEPLFMAYLKAFVGAAKGAGGEAGLSGHMAAQLQREYAQKASAMHAQLQAGAPRGGGGGEDPFKMALLKIFGRCELARKTVPRAIVTSEDYLWLQLHLVQDTAGATEQGLSSAALPAPPLTYGLVDLQRIITDFGPRHFDPKGSNPWMYFEVLLIVGHFERAIEYLYYSGHVVDAIHFAIALFANGTLHLAPLSADLPSLDSDGSSCSTDAGSLFVKGEGASSSSVSGRLYVNLCRLILDYASVRQPLAVAPGAAAATATEEAIEAAGANGSDGTVRLADAVDAVHYLLLLPLARTVTYDRICHTGMRDLILASGDYAMLLGDVSHDGTVIGGLLARYSRLMKLKDEPAFMTVITAAAGERCEAEGRFREALQLYNLAQKYARVLDVLCKRLSRAFVEPFVRDQVEDACRTASSILTYYASQRHICPHVEDAKRSLCMLLVSLNRIRILVEDMLWSRALDDLLALDVLPLEGEVAAISGAADRLRDAPDALVGAIPDLLRMAMTILVRRAADLTAFIALDSGRSHQRAIIKRMARNLMTFTGMLRLCIPQETYSALLSMEISLE